MLLSSSHRHVRFVSLLLVITTIHGVNSTDRVQFNLVHLAHDTVGGKLFIEQMGADHVKELMSSLAHGIWEFIFWQSADIREKLQKVDLFIDKAAVVSSYSHYIGFNVYEIHLSAEHIEEHKGFLKEEIRTMLTYEIAHILQYTGANHAPLALRDGVAAYVVLLMSLKPSRWDKYGDGDRWDQSPDITAHFLYYCSIEYPSFIENLNKKMKFSYSSDYFLELSDKTIDMLWKEYKTKHGSKA